MAKDSVVLLRRDVVPGYPCNDRAVWEWKPLFAICLDRRIIAQNGAYIVEAACLVSYANQLPLAISGGNCNTVNRSTLVVNPTASLILLDCRLTKGPAAGTAWQDENQSARETDTQSGDGIRHMAL